MTAAAELTNAPCPTNIATLFLLGLFTFAEGSDPTCLSSSGDDDGGIIDSEDNKQANKSVARRAND